MNYYRLDFSKHLWVFVPVFEAARIRTRKRSRSLLRAHRRALASLLAASVMHVTPAYADQPAGLVPHAGKAWSNAAIDAARTTANQMTIRQNAAKAVLNWQKLNLDQGQTLNFDQGGNRSWAALNRIFDADPSRIAGNINADGHLYFINSNGIIFGNGAQINAGSLTATSLDVVDNDDIVDRFNAGILSDPLTAAFSGTGGFVRVEQGASITAATGGRVMLLAPDVENSGIINTPDGQTILAAGQKVYLRDSEDPAGLLVEVDSGGTATNLGEIVARRGNVTLVGLAVNQQGRISASTSVRANGSIHLLARDTVKFTGGEALAQRGGVVTLGKNSITSIEVEMDDKEEALGKQIFDEAGVLINPSRVVISGGVIDIEGSIVAHGGEVTATAAFNPSLLNDQATASSTVSATRIYMGEQASIDVSGVDAIAPMSRNQLEIQLYSDQLKDTPLLRGGPLFGETVYVNAMKGTNLFDIKPSLAIKGRTIAEYMVGGGTVNLVAKTGDVILKAGSEINVSGGTTTYQPGTIKESSLVYNGKITDISQAEKDTFYAGLADVYTVTDRKWGVTRRWDLSPGGKGSSYASYSAGGDAGMVDIAAANAVLQADLVAKNSPGIYQRSQGPKGGTFSFTLNTGGMAGTPPTIHVASENNGMLPTGFSVVGALNQATSKFDAGDSLPAVLKNEILLDTSLFDNGFDHLKLNAGSGSIMTDTVIKTGPNGSITLVTSGKATVNADILVPGRNTTVESGVVDTNNNAIEKSNIVIKGGDTEIGAGVTLSAAGLFTNDKPGVAGAMSAPVAKDGGNVVVIETDSDKGGLTMGAASVIDASAGAWLDAQGKFKGGKGGNVTLTGIRDMQQVQVSSYGFSKGGTLSLGTFERAQIGGTRPVAGNGFWLPESFFGQGGFSKYSVNTILNTSDMIIGDLGGTAVTIQPQGQTLATKPGFESLASGTSIGDVASPRLLASYLRSPVSLAFKSAGALTVLPDTVIRTDAPAGANIPGGAITLEATGQLAILGSLIAPAGSISAALTGQMERFDYDSTLSLFVGENATLSATGHYAVAPPDGSGLIDAEVLDGGSIALDGGDRAVVVVKEGSLLDVSGVSGVVDVAGKDGYTRETHDGAAGTITVSARNGMSLDGDLRAGAAGKGRDGALVLAISGGDDISNKGHPNGARVLTVTQENMLRAYGLQVGDAVDALTGTGTISAEQIAAGGFGSLGLEVDRNIAGDKILLPSGLDLVVPNALTMKTSLLEVTGNGVAQIASSYVMLNGSNEAAPVAGDATLKINADFIDLVGDMAFSGVRSASLSASHDIRGRGNRAGTGALLSGSLTTPGELILGARQIYPVTNGQFGFEATGASSRIEVKSGGAAPDTLLSAGGVLTLKADDIVQGGALRAPLGRITLDAANSLTLKDGSSTSVSLDGQLVPYGLTRLGGLDLMAPNEDLVASDKGTGLSKLPEKQLTFKSPIVDMQEGAKVDISGGGDVMAYEFIKGIGGSEDFLGQVGVYAVIPDSRTDYAPFDYNYQIGSGIKPGDAVYLSGMPGLAEGTYTLLPGRYALLPGAFVVKVESGVKVARDTNIGQLDGSSLVSGYRTTLDQTSRDAQYSTFRVIDGSIFRPVAGTVSKAPAEYRLTTGNGFFTKLAQDAGLSVPRLAADAGQLTLNASASLTLAADILTGKSAGARGALVDIVSDKISVVSAVGAADGTLQLAVGSLNDMAAESLLLGGTRSQGASGMTIATNSSKVTFANDADHALEVGELIAAASDTLTVNGGAVIRTTVNTQATGTTKMHASGDGALLAVSSLNDIEFDRSGISASPVKGTLNVAGGASLNAGRSMVLDSTLAATLDGDATVDTGGSVTLGANRILLGDAGSETGMKVSNSMLGNFGDLSMVSLNSYKNIDIYGPVAFGNDQLDITFNAGGIARHVGVGENTGDSEANRAASLTARNFVLKNSAAATFETPVAVAGSVLNIDAENITLAGGVSTTGTAIDGFDKVNLTAAKETGFSGTGSTTVDALETNVTSTRITAAIGTDFKLIASGILNTASVATPATLAAADGLGARLTLAAASVTLGGNVELPSGQFTAQAMTGNLTVANGAGIKAASVPVTFDKYTEHTPGGSVTLQADAGSVTVDAGSTIDVSGGAGGDAGVLKVIAVNGSTTVNGVLNGQAIAGQQAGSFVLDTKTLPDFSGLNTALNNGGFTASRDMRIRSGDVTIAAGDTVTAEKVVISADAGNIVIAGTVDADGANGGSIAMHARDNVTIKNTGQLLARGTGDTLVAGDTGTGAGGSVMLSSLSMASIDAVTAESGALIDVSGDQQGAVAGKKGSVTMRAYRGTTGSANTVNVAFAATAAVKGAEQVRLEGVKVYNSATFAANTSTIVADTNAFYAANPGSGSYAATQDGATISVLPNIEVRSTDTETPTDLTIAADLNMRALGALQAGKGGTLTLRANKDLKINGSLSDGFSTATTAGLLQTGNTFSYELVSGADFSAANSMATIKSATSGNLDLASNKLIRTGKGDIRIATGGNLTMGNEGSVIYTVGRKADTLAGFTNPASALYLTDGGDIDIRVRGNIDGKFVSSVNQKLDGNQQLITHWLFRQGGGTASKQVSWWVRPDLFKQGVATLGGGDVTISSGGSITNFSASAATTARYASADNYVVDGGGDVTVTAGADINSGLYFAGQGDIRIHAGGAIQSSANTFGTTIALMDASAEVSAVRNAAIETVFNPTMWAQVTGNASTFDKTGSNAFFLTYGENSAFKLSSLAGDAGLGLTSSASIAGDIVTGTNSTTTAKDALETHPGTVKATAFSGDIVLGRLVLAPAATGDLSLLAAGDINGSLIAMSDYDAALLPGVTNPVSNSGGLSDAINQFRFTKENGENVASHAGTPVHLGDEKPVVIIAKEGSISLAGVSTSDKYAGAGLLSPKAVYLHAGKDITLDADIQHLGSNDISVIDAGRDFSLPTDPGSIVQLGGPGELLVQAGHNVSLGSTQGIVTIANTANANLPDEGASITVLAGLGKEGANLSDYIATYIDPMSSGPEVLQGDDSKFADYRQQTGQAVTAYMRNLSGNNSLSEADAMTRYLALDKDRQEVFAYRHFSAELLASANGYATSGNHNRGDTAIATLFPATGNYDGDLALFNSQLRTLRDGNIDILTPGGFINVGVPTSSGTDIGIVTERGGDIRAFAETGFQVEQSKVITQYGSDITVWVNNGDIDAGRGSKTAISVPERVVTTNTDGDTTIEVKGVAAGSGIRAQTYDPDGPDGAGQAPDLGSVALIAPRGVLNAGEAGIAAGNFLAVATQVIGASNIAVSGTSTGVPAADTGSLGSSLAGVSNVASDATKSVSDDVARQVSQNTNLNSFLPSFISVEVIGLGD